MDVWLSGYIANFLERMSNQSKKIFELSLVDYGNVPVDMQYFIRSSRYVISSTLLEHALLLGLSVYI